MALKNDIELFNTREKLRELESRYEQRKRETPANPHVHELTLHSLKRLILTHCPALHWTIPRCGGRTRSPRPLVAALQIILRLARIRTSRSQ